ncbi:MAG TPA: DNA (cytosine-5-)-methyltransferase [Planctomycetaceae bacterium]|nr:DNA (cytosine-5-)-methyltransferase [Planctomycetaceae bacterium]HRF00777.1 DNA (cytosine-5-)-methyltransferase [Pirellulaceae bacterium]
MRDARHRSTRTPPRPAIERSGQVAPREERGSRQRTVELFAGIGGFRLAADRLGIETVWANDLGAHAAKVYADRFGTDSFVAGDIAKLIESIPEHDLLTGGFPCQPFSAAGKKRGIADPRGTHFALVARVLAERRPAAFLLENVRRLLTMDRGRHFATILSTLVDAGYRVEWRLLNAADFGLAQNRYRLVIAGLRDDRVDAAAFDRSAGLAANDLEARPSLETEARAIGAANDVVGTKGLERYREWGRADRRGFVTTSPREFGDRVARVTLAEILQPPRQVPRAYDFTESTRRRLGASERVGRLVDGVEILANQAGGARMGYTVFGTRGLAPTLTATASRHYERYRVGRRYRRLTPIEYARLQGFPDDHCDAVPSGWRYRLFGNAVPPPLVEWPMRRLVERLAERVASQRSGEST